MLRDKLKLALVVAIVMAICGMLVFSSASIVKAVGTETTIEIVDKVGDTAITTITFPEGAPLDVISDPYNDVNGSGDPQVLHPVNSEPVVRLKNTSGGPLTVWLKITAWTNGVVVSERYKLVDTGIGVKKVDDVLSATGGAATVNTGISMAATTYKALYLEVTLGAGYGKSGSSTLTILGEI